MLSLADEEMAKLEQFPEIAENVKISRVPTPVGAALPNDASTMSIK